MTRQEIHCHHCATKVTAPPLRPGESVRCGVCRTIVRRRGRTDSFQPACALAVAGLVFLLLANIYPIMLFGVAGNTQTNDIVTGILVLRAQGYWPIAILVLFCAVIAPALYFGGVAYVAASCGMNRPLPWSARVLGVVRRVESWSLVPVFAAACFVAVVKLDLIGYVDWQVGIFWILCLSLCSLGLGSLFDPVGAARVLEMREGRP